MNEELKSYVHKRKQMVRGDTTLTMQCTEVSTSTQLDSSGMVCTVSIWCNCTMKFGKFTFEFTERFSVEDFDNLDEVDA